MDTKSLEERLQRIEQRLGIEDPQPEKKTFLMIDAVSVALDALRHVCKDTYNPAEMIRAAELLITHAALFKGYLHENIEEKEGEKETE